MNNQTELSGPINQSVNKVENLIFFLHGWGSDGNDLIQISHLWKKEIHNVTFLAPNGPETCPQNPNGKQWFDILSENTEEMFQGLCNSFSLLDKYIDNQLSNLNLEKKTSFWLVLAKAQCFHFMPPLRRKCKGIIGYSGAYLEGPLPKNIIKNDILLIHGQIDPIVPLERMKQAEEKFQNLSSGFRNKNI